MAHPKGVLIEQVQKLGLPRPEFRTERTGPEHEPQFASEAVIDGDVLGSGQGGSKRVAERRAAEAALAALDARAEGRATTAKDGPATPKSTKRRTRKSAQQPEAEVGAAGRLTPRPDDASDHPAADEVDAAEEPFAGPWPMFDDLLASVLQVAERRVSSELRGEAALVAVRDFSLRLYKDLLSDLGEVVEEEEDDEDENEDED